MEIRLMEKNPKTGRFKNVEIYKEQDFKKLVRSCFSIALKDAGFFERLRGNFSNTINKAEKLLGRQFKDRLKKNKNR